MIGTAIEPGHARICAADRACLYSGVTLDAKLQHLRSILAGMDSVLVAYSGGVDSSLLLKVASDVLGERALGVIADSESLPREELSAALDLARRFQLSVLVVRTHELQRPEYRANRQDRCYHCKAELFERLTELASERGIASIAYGANLDDQNDIRPGFRAAREYRIRAPLIEAGLTKADVREIARSLELPTWDKPAFACLSSRVPFGSKVTPRVLARIEAAEDVLRGLGFRQFRVRHHDTVARVEVGQDEMARLLEPGVRQDVVAGMQAAGYTYVTLDLGGYRSGSAHEAGRKIPLRAV
jgi:uncharacterized protein